MTPIEVQDVRVRSDRLMWHPSRLKVEPVIEAARPGVGCLVADVEQGADLVMPRRHRPVAVV